MNSLAPIRSGDVIRPAGVCPCCGGDIDPDEIIIDIVSNRVGYRGHVLKLGPAEAEIMAVLVVSSPGSVQHEKIVSALWGGYDAPLTAEKTMHVHVHNLRARLKTIGLGVENIWATGYRLVKAGGEK